MLFIFGLTWGLNFTAAAGAPDPEALRWFVGLTHVRVEKRIPFPMVSKHPALISEQQLEDFEDDARGQVLRSIPLARGDFFFGARQIRRIVVAVEKNERHVQADVSVALLLNLTPERRANLNSGDLDLSAVTEVRNIELRMLQIEFPRVSDPTFMAGRDVTRIWEGHEDLRRRIWINARRFRAFRPTLEIKFFNAQKDWVSFDLAGDQLIRTLGGCGEELEPDRREYPPLRVIRGGVVD